MADYYVCKYSSKYISELVYAFEKLRDLKECEQLRVLSFGCGPCTDLMALENLKAEGKYGFKKLEFLGIDYEETVWARIHADLIKESAERGIKVRFLYLDAGEFIKEVEKLNWVPDLVTFQYFFSDMYKNTTTSKINDFIARFAKFANNRMQPGSYMVLNDVNLSTRLKGGRECFGILLSKLDSTQHQELHFVNSNPGKKTYLYGDPYNDNRLRAISPEVGLYRPFETCSSAQMIIKKVVS